MFLVFFNTHAWKSSSRNIRIIIKPAEGTYINFCRPTVCNTLSELLHDCTGMCYLLESEIMHELKWSCSQ